MGNVKNKVKSYFESVFSTQKRPRPVLDRIQFKTLTRDDNLFLSVAFSLDEIKDVVWSCDGDKSSGSDGFNFRFYKEWDLIGMEVSLLVEEFYCKYSLPKGICSSFIALIPKKENPQKLGDFRPISLIGSIHKIISKLLALRLKRVIGPLISKCQSASILNKQILDGVLAINELVDLARKKRKKCFIMKVEFEKAYDSVDWDYLIYLM